MKLALVGEIYVDHMLYSDIEDKLRFGGIVHAARCLNALEIEYDCYYIAPSYLKNQVDKFLTSLKCSRIVPIGEVFGAPNIMAISEPRESGDQGYENILFKEKSVKLNVSEFQNHIGKSKYSDILIISGDYNLKLVLSTIKSVTDAKTYLDIANGETEIDFLSEFSIEHLFLSTSSKLFLEKLKGSYEELRLLKNKLQLPNLTLKEGRGGSRTLSTSGEVLTPAFVEETVHSVGVGDVFDAAYICLRNRAEQEVALRFASLIASDYASTTFPDRIASKIKLSKESDIKSLMSVRAYQVPWENRPDIHIYIAAPDFDYVDRRPIDDLAKALKYHNFSPRLPVREHGQANKDMTSADRSKLAQKDWQLVKSCKILIAVMIYNDPGTLIEIGMALEANIPVLVFDPIRSSENLMLTQLPRLVSADLAEIIRETFSIASELVEEALYEHS